MPDNSAPLQKKLHDVSGGRGDGWAKKRGRVRCKAERPGAARQGWAGVRSDAFAV